ncbi:CHASE domain-containing protein [Mesorhizobium sp. LHD-90]|uniref:CHASE domain-containing protein n=1 Tax=Mesorhizobium sp. LHD-90 TaxID=3071414 RepID=UPI0027E1F75C|nr:CHASE domain-containing protein [Mesorhizobium sp. LHD-90]MDQ6433584.1 CHASE domain-containing protein [Mesorhizobium sp. LHD-90]
MKKLLPYLAFAAVAIASLVTAGFAYRTGEEAARFKFEAAADDALGRLESRLDLDLSLLVSTQAFFEARYGNVTKAEFSNYYVSLHANENFPGLRGVGFLSLVRNGAEAAVEQKISSEFGFPREVFPASTESWRAPVTLFEPLDENSQEAIGFDMYSEPARRAAIEAALSSGGAKATGRVVLGQNTGSNQPAPGILVYSALRAKAADPEGAGNPSVGLVFVSFRTAELFYSALVKPPILPVNVEVHDGPPSADTLLFRSEAPPDSRFSDDFLVTRKLIVGGREWTLQFRPTSGFQRPSSRALPILLGLAGLMLAGAMAALARYQERTYEAKSRLHDATERSLAEKDLMLQEMKHRIKNSIARVLAIARQTASNSADIKEFSDSFAARLQAMAASQDMLTRSRWQKADLGDLLRMELEQVFGKTIPEDALSGPKVLLNETATQSLGLTFHELATNALKYGTVASSVSALAVAWTVERMPSERRLRLRWKEAGSTLQNQGRGSGFGTRLIEMNITRELNGRITRDFGADGLTIDIDIPLDRDFDPRMRRSAPAQDEPVEG